MQVKTITEQLFFTTVRIDTKDQKENSGSGTGFFFDYIIGGIRYPFVVTNKHVVQGTREGTFSFLKERDGQPALGDGFNLNIEPATWAAMWYGHPDADIDIAIFPYAPMEADLKNQFGVTPFIRALNQNFIPTEDQLAELDAIEPVTFVGYPNGIWDSKNLLPVARRGTTATPIEVDFENTPRFIIDASVFGGSSGSPVFVINQGSYGLKDGGIAIGSRFYFVGVIAAVFYRTQLNQIVPVPIPTQMRPMAEQQEMIDLGIVFKAHTVVSAIESFLKSQGVEIPTPATNAPPLLP